MVSVRLCQHPFPSHPIGERRAGGLSIECFRRDIDPTSPYQSTQFRINSELAEEVDIAKPFEDAPALKIRREVDYPTFAIVEGKLDPVIIFVRCRYDIVKHDLDSLHSALAIVRLQSAAHYRAAAPGYQIERARRGNVALALAARKLIAAGLVPPDPLLDLRIDEDLRADMDMNVSMNRDGLIIEVQGTAERQPFDQAMLNRLLDRTAGGIGELLRLQCRALE